MKRMTICIIILASLIIASSTVAVPPCTSLDQYREEGSTRTYKFLINEQKFGILESKYEGESDFDGIDAYKFEEKLSFDYTPMGNPLKIAIIDRHFVDDQGRYIGTELNAAVDTVYQNLHLKRQGDTLVGIFNNNGAMQNLNIPLPQYFRAIDNNMIDQLESFLAFKGVEVGDTISDSIFVPQVLQKTMFKGTVDGFVGISYGDLFDSAYIINFTDPAIQKAYFTRSRKLIRLDLESQNIRVILSESALDAYEAPSAPYGISDFIKRLPYYAIYLLIGFIFSLPFIKKSYKMPEIYIALILGGIAFTLLNITQVPLQKWYGSNYLIPGLKEGGSLYLLGIINALISGVVQEALKLIPIALIYIIRRPLLRHMIPIGLFCGLGFGIYEAGAITGAALQSGTMSIFSWGLFERFFAILFHAATGVLLAYGLARGLGKILIIWPLAALLHSLTNYLIVFLHRRVIDIGLFEIMTAFIVLVFTLVVYLLAGRRR